MVRKNSFFSVCKGFCHWTKRLYMRNWFFYLLTHNTCLLFVFWWLFNMVWNKNCIEKDSKYLVNVVNSQRAFQFPPIFIKLKMNEITGRQLLLGKKLSWRTLILSCFWGWNEIGNTFWDLATFKRPESIHLEHRAVLLSNRCKILKPP